MFTPLSQFTYGSFFIPNIEEQVSNNNTALLIHIQKFEEDALRLIIGDCMYEDLMNNVKTVGGYYQVVYDADPKWDWLVNGKTYQSNNHCNCGCGGGSCNQRKWRGLVRNVATISGMPVRESILAPYIFYHWSLNYRTLNGGIGEYKGKAGGTITVSSSDKRVDAWNEFVQNVDFGLVGAKVPLYDFLNSHKSEFSNFKQNCFNTITYWDI